MEKKEFNKVNVLALIEEKRVQAKFAKDMAKRKRDKYMFDGWSELCDILEYNISAIWSD